MGNPFLCSTIKVNYINLTAKLNIECLEYKTGFKVVDKTKIVHTLDVLDATNKDDGKYECSGESLIPVHKIIHVNSGTNSHYYSGIIIFNVLFFIFIHINLPRE
jgi:hypothetical protein